MVFIRLESAPPPAAPAAPKSSAAAPPPARPIVKKAEKEEDESEDEDCAFLSSDEESFDEEEMDAELATVNFEKKREKGTGTAKHARTNVNVFRIAFSNLEEDANDLTGDPVLCKRCGVILNSFSKLEPIEKEKSLETEKVDMWKAPPIHPKVGEFVSDDVSITEDSQVWRCEFCDEINIVELDEEEIPVSETVDYLLEAPSTPDDDGDNSNVVFCIGK